MKMPRLMPAALVFALLVSGPLTPMAAVAQVGQTAPAIDPPLTSQKPGEQRVPIDPQETMLMRPVEPHVRTEPTKGDAVAAGFMNVVYVPGKVIVCTAGVLTSTVLMLATFGSAYRAARSVLLEGCAAPWALTAEYVSGKIPGPGDTGYDPAGRDY